MRTFREYYEDGEHLRDYERVALLAGGFKPPHKGHLMLFKQLLKDADKGVIFIGKKQDRPGRKWIHLKHQKLFGRFIHKAVSQ